MAFWSSNDVEPTRQFRFKVQTGEGDWWWAKSVTKPSFSVNESEYQLVNHKFKYPGIVTWNNVIIRVVDPNNRAKYWYDKLISYGWDEPNKVTGFLPDGLSKDEIRGALQYIKVIQLDSSGDPVESWNLNNPKITSVNFGSLEYSSDELVVLDIEISYDWANLEELAI
tara:strand:+ start:133 stop:636 length:504 start_codon:yes stop_codon:yes gene_type:complete